VLHCEIWEITPRYRRFEDTVFLVKLGNSPPTLLLQ